MDLIIGAGISGVSYAMFANTNDYLILEKEQAYGGYCRTTARNGFVWDYSGHFFHFQDAQIKRMLLDGLDFRLLVTVDKNTSIKYGDRLIDYPFQKNIHQLPKQELIDCLVDLFEPKPATYANFKEMLYCKFGKSIAEKFLIPYNEKLYATPLNRLDKDAMGRFFPYAEKEEIILNFRRGGGESYNGSFVYPRTGAITYVDEAVKHIDTSKIVYGADICRIDTAEKIAYAADGRSWHYDRLISTIPFPRLLEITGTPYDKSVYSSNKVLVFNIGFDSKGPDTTSHWIYFPGKEFCFYRVGFYDNILGTDRTSLYVELGFPSDAEVNVEECYGRVLGDLVKAGVVGPEQRVADHQSIIMNPAYVHISEKSSADVREKKDLLAESGVYSIGRYGSWTYCSIEDNIKEARHLAETII